MGPADDDDRPGETGPEDGPRAAGAPPGAGAAHPGAGRSADHPDHPDQAAVPNGAPGHGAAGNGASHNGAGNGAVGVTGNGAADPAAGSPAALLSAPDWDPHAPDAGPARDPGPAVAVDEPPVPAPVSAGAPPAPPGPGFVPASPPPRTHRWGLGAYVLVEVIFLVASYLISELLATSGAPAASSLAIALAVPTVLAAATALLITRLRGNGPVADLGLTASWRDVGLGVAFGVGGLVVTIPASVLFVAIAGEDATSAVGDVFGDVSASVPWAVAVFLIVVLVAPLCEEIVYRGLLWGGVERLAGPRVAFGVSTLLFALAHLEFARTPLLLVVALPIAAARYYTGRLTSSIIAHQINNLLPGVALLLGLLGVVPLA